MIEASSCCRSCGVLTRAATRARLMLATARKAPIQNGSFTFQDGRSPMIDVTIDEADGATGIVWPETG